MRLHPLVSMVVELSLTYPKLPRVLLKQRLTGLATTLKMIPTKCWLFHNRTVAGLQLGSSDEALEPTLGLQLGSSVRVLEDSKVVM